MARCDQGYLCRVCGEEVEDIVDSELYLQFVIGWVDPETLHTTRECHLRCNPTFSQFIEDSRFDPPAIATGEWSKHTLDPEFVAERTTIVSRGYARLWEIFNDEDPPPVTEYPLPEIRSKWR